MRIIPRRSVALVVRGARPGYLSALALLAAACAKNAAEVPPAHAAPAAARPDDNAGANAKGDPSSKDPAAPDSTPPPGVDLTKLDEFERKVFFRIINKEPSACGKAHSLAHSVKNDRACRKSLYAVKYVVRLVDSGYTDSEIADYVRRRFMAGAPKKIDVSEAPFKGNPNAPITLVEFVDYECPHCKRIQPVLRQLVDEFKNEVKVHFKHYPLGSHTNSRLAAEAAVAAQKQGKFWPYNEKIWANSESLTPAALEEFAKEVGLDVAKWRQDLAAEDTKNRVQKDRADGGALGIQSTPTIYLNGREYTDHRDIESLRDWIVEELGR